MSTTPRRLPRWAVTLAVAGILTVLASGAAAAVAVSADPPQPVCVPGTMSPDGRFVIDCQVPLPSASTVTVTTPVLTVVPTTVTETVTTTPSPSATTSSPTTPAPTTPPATTPAPSTSTSTPAGGCMAKPSACGWPDETNTGVPPGTVLTVRQGNWTLSQRGQVIDGMDIRGCVTVTAQDVVIKRSRITCNGFSGIAIGDNNRSANLLVEDSEIVMSALGQHGIQWHAYTARRVHIMGGSDCFSANADVVIEDSFCDIPGEPGTDVGRNGGPHVDGIQDTGSARNITVRHNTIRNPFITTSAIILDGGTSGIRIVDNLLAGGGYVVYCPSGSALAAWSGNVISRVYYPRGGYFGPVTGCPSSGWRWDG